MLLQKDELRYYAETGKVVRIFNIIFDIFNYLNFTNNKYRNYLFVFDINYYFSIFLKIYILSNKIFFKIFIKESYFIKNFLLLSSKLLIIKNFYYYCIYYLLLYI